MSPPNPSPGNTSTGPGPPGLPPAGGRPWPTTCPPRVPPEPGFVGRDWVFELIVDWLEHGHERFLILEAEPGWGKSALVAQLVHVSDDPARTTGSAALDRISRAVGAAFFCSSSGGSTMNPITFASCIAAQFIARYPAYADAVLRRLAPGQVNVTQTVGHLSGDGELIGVLTKYLHIESPNARDVYEHAVRAPLADPSVTADELVIVVDGLDDSLKAEPSIADLVAHSTDFPDRIRFLVTTRRSEPVRRLFLDAAGSARREDLGDAGRRPLNDGDIAAYVRSRDGEAPLAPWVQHAGGIDPLAARIADASDGNFLYARLLLDHSPGEDQDELLPPDLDSQYERLLGRVIPAADLAAEGSVWTKVLRPFLGTIAVSIPAAPVDPLRRWLGDRDALMLGQQQVGELTEWLADEGGWLAALSPVDGRVPVDRRVHLGRPARRERLLHRPPRAAPGDRRLVLRDPSGARGTATGCGAMRMASVACRCTSTGSSSSPRGQRAGGGRRSCATWPSTTPSRTRSGRPSATHGRRSKRSGWRWRPPPPPATRPPSGRAPDGSASRGMPRCAGSPGAPWPTSLRRSRGRSSMS